MATLFILFLYRSLSSSSAYCGYVKEVVGDGFGPRAVGEMEVLRAIRAVYATVTRMWYVLRVVELF